MISEANKVGGRRAADVKPLGRENRAPAVPCLREKTKNEKAKKNLPSMVTQSKLAWLP